MGKSRNSLAGRDARRTDDQAHGTLEESSPDKKKTKHAPEDEEFDSSDELDEDDHKVAEYITKNVSVKLKDQVSSDIKEGFKEFADLLKNLSQSTTAALETAKEAILIAKAGEEKIAVVEKSVNEKIAEVERNANSRIEVAEKTAKVAQKKAEEAIAVAENLGKLVSELENKFRSGASGGSSQFLQTISMGDSSTVFEETVQPTSTASDRLKKLFSTYSGAIHAAKTSRTFVLGRKKGETPPTQAAAKILMECFFPDVGCIVTTTDKAKVAKVYVPKPEEAQQLKLAIKNTWAALGSQGWWIREDIPESLGKLETRAREFFIEAKKADKMYEKKIGYVSIEYGVASKDGKELLPLFLIPPQSSVSWPALFPMIVARIESFSGEALLGEYAASNDEAFYNEWLKAAGLSKLADDIRAVRDMSF